MSLISSLNRAIARNRDITDQEWEAISKELTALPKKASPEVERLLRIYGNDQIQLGAKAKEGIRKALVSFGYPVSSKRPTNAVELNKIIDSNISQPDKLFNALGAATGAKKRTITVAVLDDGGSDFKHPALDGNQYVNQKEARGKPGVDDDGNGKVDDTSGFDYAANDANPDPARHSKHVGGKVAEGTDQIKVLPCRILPGKNPGKQIAAAIDDAAAQGATVMNLSLDVMGRDVAPVVEAIKRHPNVTFVVAAGNKKTDLSTRSPKNSLSANVLDNMIVVAAADESGKRASYSNYGAPHATVATQGSNVLSAGDDKNPYVFMNGTSMATPAISNMVAKAKLLNPSLTPTDLKKMLIQTTEKSDAWKDDVVAGGLVVERRFHRLAALTQLVRSGHTLDEAADRINLNEAQRELMFPMVKGYVPNIPGGTFYRTAMRG